MTTTQEWYSIDPYVGRILWFQESNKIEDAFEKGEISIFLDNLARTIHFNGPHLYQTTAAIGNKNNGYRSVIRGIPGEKIIIYYWSPFKRWYAEKPDFYVISSLCLALPNPPPNLPQLWQWCDCSGSNVFPRAEKHWNNYSNVDSEEIEKGYQNNSEVIIGVGLSTYKIHSFQGTYAIQENTATNIKRSVRRGCMESSPIVLTPEQQDEKCALCYDDFAETLSIPIRKLNCGHSYHWTCIARYLENELHNPLCPICRAAINN